MFIIYPYYKDHLSAKKIAAPQKRSCKINED